MAEKYRWHQRNDTRLQKVITALEEKFGEPERRSGLDALQVLVLTILSQNTTDQNSRTAYVNLLREFPADSRQKTGPETSPADYRVADSAKELPAPDWSKLLAASQDQLESVIAPAGLQKSKTETILALLAWLKDRRGDFQLEAEFSGLDANEAIEKFTAIKGIGVKTAAVVLMEAAEKDICPVDTHVARVSQRLKFVEHEGSNREKIFRQLQPIIPPGKAYGLHHNLLSFGREVCRAQSPQCSECPVAELCWDLRCRRGGEALTVKFR